MVAPIDLTGRKFGRWTALERQGLKWLCRCQCGAERAVDGGSLRAGRSLSCGCHNIDSLSARTFRHGHTGKREGGKRQKASRTYNIWQSMRHRCNDPKHDAYRYYGGRGIRVCDGWNASFEAFLADMGEAPDDMQIDRWPNNDGDYEPRNCRWATRKEQRANRRDSRRGG